MTLNFFVNEFKYILSYKANDTVKFYTDLKIKLNFNFVMSRANPRASPLSFQKKSMFLYIFFVHPILQLFSEKCTGRYFKVRDDYLSSKHKQGPLCTFKMILIKISRKYYKVYIYLYIFIFVIKLKHDIFFFVWIRSINRLMRPLLRQLLDR